MALEVCAHAHVTTEHLLRTVLGDSGGLPRASLAGETVSVSPTIRTSRSSRLRTTRAPADGAPITPRSFGYSSYFTLTDENGWSLAEAEKWLPTQASSVLLA